MTLACTSIQTLRGLVQGKKGFLFAWGKNDAQNLFDLKLNHGKLGDFANKQDYFAWGSSGLDLLLQSYQSNTSKKIQGIKGILNIQSNKADLQDFNGATYENKLGRAQATKMSKLCGQLGYTQIQVKTKDKAPNFWNVALIFNKKTCQPNTEAQYALQHFINPSSLQLIQNGQLTACEIVDYELLTQHPDYQNIIQEIHSSLNELIQDYGIKLDAITIVEDRRPYAAQIENFGNIAGREFKKILRINANTLRDKYSSLAAL